MALGDPQAQENDVGEHAHRDGGAERQNLDHDKNPRENLARVSERVDQLAGELEELLSPLPAPLKRRALGQFLARIEDTLASRTEATRGEKRRALGFGFGALVAGAAP